MDKQVVLGYIGNGKNHSVSREYLCEKTGLTDRKIRKHIAALRKDGYFILNDEDGKGYYRCTNINKIESNYWKEWRRALSTLSKLKKQREFLIEQGCDMNPNHRKGNNNEMY